MFLEDNLKAIETFPRTMLLPGFWSEYGMCTEPSAFGSIPVWGENDFPFAKRVVRSLDDIERLEPPDPRKHGLLPFMINRLRHLQPAIRAAGHEIRFAVARGPLNIASFLMGTTEFLTALKTDPEITHRFLALVTDFLVDWIRWQRECFPSIDGILVLDDIVGAVSGRDFETFGQPYLARVFDADVTIKFFHNDAPCKACAPYLQRHWHQPPQLRPAAHAERDEELDRPRRSRCSATSRRVTFWPPARPPTSRARWRSCWPPSTTGPA